jgi:hypothetical protein
MKGKSPAVKISRTRPRDRFLKLTYRAAEDLRAVSVHVVLVRDRTVLRQSQKLEIDAVTKLRHGQRLSGSRTPFDKTQDDLRSPASADKA